MMSGPIDTAQTTSDTHPQHHRHNFPQRQPDLSKEELRVLKECSTESFWFRCVPISIAFISATQFAVNKGYLTRHHKYGSLVKSVGAGFLGYILGKFSYQGECRKKIMALPESRLAEALRQRKGGRLMEEMVTHVPDLPKLSRSPGAETSRADVYSSGMELDSDRDTSKGLQGLDDRQRPSMDNDSAYSKPEEAGPSSDYVDYDELRKRNRLELQQKSKPVSSGTESSPDPFSRKPWPPPPLRDMGPSGPSRTPPPPRQQTGANKYGDVWDD